MNSWKPASVPDIFGTVKMGFVYKFEIVDTDGNVRDTSYEHNIIPDVGRDYMLTAALLAGSQVSTWYIGLYSTAYTPVAADTMTTLMANVTEITNYTGGVRLTLTPDALAAGVYSNAGTPAEFVFSSAATVRGGFISSNSTQGSTTGTLLSGELNSSPKTLATGETLRVTAGLAIST